VGLGALALSSIAFTAPAFGGAPNHPRDLAHDIAGFNHACGTAVDSEGDIYVSSAGEGKIKIFDPGRTQIGFIASGNEPCGLGVDSRGTLFVSERGTGDVVRYRPNEYPFSAPPSYHAPEAFDASGEAEGIAVDPVDDGVYIAKGDHIDAYGNESYRIQINGTGTYKLVFNGEPTASLDALATHGEVQDALEALPSIGADNVSVVTGNFSATDHLITFVGALGLSNVNDLTVDASGLSSGVFPEVTQGGLIAPIGVGDLTNATGVAAYSYVISKVDKKITHYVYAADAATDQVKVFSGAKLTNLKLRKEIDGPKPGEDFEFGTEGAYMAVDPGNRDPLGKCLSVDEQACTAGHFLVYDAGHGVVDEFDATGEFLDQFSIESFTDAEPTAMAIDRSGGISDGSIYVTAGAGAGARLLAFGPLAVPSRVALPDLSKSLATARSVTIDLEGNVYVAAGSAIYAFASDGKKIEVGPGGGGIPTGEPAEDIAVDSTGKIYALVTSGSDPANHKVQYYTPGAYPPTNGTQYAGPTTAATGNSFLTPASISAIGINPLTDHIFVGSTQSSAQMIELGSAVEGSPILDDCFACGLIGGLLDIAVYGDTGSVYVATQVQGVRVIEANGNGILTEITGAGSPVGSFGGQAGRLAVNQSNGNVLIFKSSRGIAEEYDGAGAFVAEFGTFTPLVRGSGIAIDNSGGQGDGNVYVAYDDTAPGSFDLTAFGSLAYGEAPLASTGIASDLDAGNATLHGTVDPRGFALEACRFEYLTDAQYLSNGKTFAGALSVPCAETLPGIGKGTESVPVHADLGGLDLDVRYRFQFIAENKYGQGNGGVGVFGPPLLEPRSALPVFFDEATLRAAIDPSGLETEYHFDYGVDGGYGQSTTAKVLAPSDGPIAIQATVTGLVEGTEYHFRLVAENDAKVVEGPDQTLTTEERAAAQNCPNVEFRSGFSANLPDCRVYELVTPADTRGGTPSATTTPTAAQKFNNWLVAPRGAEAGESLAYFVPTLPGFEGTGVTDGYRAERANGAHPMEGWVNELAGPTYAQVGVDGTGKQFGVASDQRYWLYRIAGASEAVSGATLSAGNYLRTPAGFEPIGRGSLGTDMTADSRFISGGGGHITFFSEAHLEEKAAPAGTMSIYDRAAGSASAEVVSVKPDGSAFGAGEDAAYLAASEDGSAVIFEVGDVLYVRHEGATTEVASGTNTFAGIADDGDRVFYADGPSGSSPASLFACDVEAGPCAGLSPSAHAPTMIAQESVFVNVSSDGTHAFFTSEEALSDAEANEAGDEAKSGEHNLYAWDGASKRFVGLLDSQDFISFDGNGFVNLRRWTGSITAGIDNGRSDTPTRSTPSGEVFAFQSHAQLTPYDNDGHSQIYRYEPDAAEGQGLVCVSCSPTGAPASADSQFLVNSGTAGVTLATTLVSNVTDDGQAVFFQSPDRLLPEDANDAQDVYKWTVDGAAGCKRAGGCLALISSGQGEESSYLYGMSADGHDVFFETSQKLVGQDLSGSPSLYDARVDGGIPDPPSRGTCHGDACQGTGSIPPALPNPASAGLSGGGNVTDEAKPRCPKGKRAVRRKGKTRCVKPRTKKPKPRRANQNRRTHR